MKKSADEITATMEIPDIAHLNDSTPKDNESESLMIPTSKGPNPKPSRFITKNNIAEHSERMEAGTRRCATEITGPRYMLCKNAQILKHASDIVISWIKSVPIINGIETIIHIAGVFKYQLLSFLPK